MPEMTQLMSIIKLLKHKSLIYIDGGIQMTNNNVRGVSNSVISFGKDATNTVINNNNNGVSEDLLMQLFKEIDASELKNDEKMN